jgi:hypothetical protein
MVDWAKLQVSSDNTDFNQPIFKQYLQPIDFLSCIETSRQVSGMICCYYSSFTVVISGYLQQNLVPPPNPIITLNLF